MVEVRYRHAAPSDLEELYTIEKKIFGKDSFSRPSLRNLIDDTCRSIVYLAEYEDRIVGFGVSGIRPFREAVYDNPGPFLSLGIQIALDDPVGVMKSIAVIDDSRFRRKGIGTQLVRCRMEWLKSRNVRHTFTHVIPGGHFLYFAKKLNYTPVKGWKGKVYSDGSEALLFYKYLT